METEFFYTTSDEIGEREARNLLGENGQPISRSTFYRERRYRGLPVIGYRNNRLILSRNAVLEHKRRTTTNRIFGVIPAVIRGQK